MKIVTISDARRFSLESVQRGRLATVDGVSAELVCFEAGQADPVVTLPVAALYQVLEGEAVVRSGGTSTRLGKGKLASVEAGAERAIENAGGGLLVVLVITAA